jgi:hypothetical protein
MVTPLVSTVIAAACVCYSVKTYWATRGMVHPVYKVKVCSVCKLPRDASVFAGAQTSLCRACEETRRVEKGCPSPQERPPGRLRLLRTQVARIQRELKKVQLKVTACQCRDLLGVLSADDLWAKLEGCLGEGMTEDNYGQWHVDHKVPVAMFDLTQDTQRTRCFHHTNMTPMWACDNLAKGSHNKSKSD